MATTTKLLNKITPQCENLHKTIKLASFITLALTSVVLVLLLAAIIYNYVLKNDTPAPTLRAGEETDTTTEDKKKKIIGGLTISAAIIGLVSVLSSLWSAMIGAKTAKTCI